MACLPKCLMLLSMLSARQTMKVAIIQLDNRPMSSAQGQETRTEVNCIIGQVFGEYIYMQYVYVYT